MNIPKYLYRYTDADSLEYMLLGEHTIRFNPLTKMDDKQEQMSRYENRIGVHVTANIGNFFFINSWTDNEEEDVRMYENYGNANRRGIRIKMPVNPFSKEKNNLCMDINGKFATAVALISDVLEERYGCECDLFIHKKYMQKLSIDDPVMHKRLCQVCDSLMRSSVSCMTRDVDKLLVKVNYTENDNYVIPTVQHVYGTQGWSDFSAFGRYKSPGRWAYQREWRYMLAFSMTLVGRNTGDRLEWYPLPFNHFDLKLDDKKLQEMEITLSPFISDDGRKKVQEIVSRSGMDIPIYESALI